MNGVDVLSARDLRNNTGKLIQDAERGQLSLITRHGKPMILAVPLSSPNPLRRISRSRPKNMSESMGIMPRKK